MEITNFIVDKNRFALAAPPKWFLLKLHEYDPSLVIVPSRQGFYYRLAQRRKPSLKDQIAYDAMKEQADTAMLMSHSLIPVTTILANPRWDNPMIFTELTRRAPWRMGGAEEYEKLVIAQDKAEEDAKQAEIDNMLDVLAKDSAGLYGKLTGVRTAMWSPRTPSRAPKPAERAPGVVIKQNKPAYRPQVVSGFQGDRQRLVTLTDR